MKPQTETVTANQMFAAINQLEFQVKFHNAEKFLPGIVAFDGDLIPVKNINDARWLFSKAGPVTTIVKIGNDGTMIHLTST